VYITDDRGFIINSQNDETLTNSISPTIAPSKGGKEGKKRVDPSLSQKIRTQAGCKRAKEQIMFQSPLSQMAKSEKKENHLTPLCKIF
jgi:hypothetical protein